MTPENISQTVIQVEDAEGKPLPNATVVVVEPDSQISLKTTVVEGGGARLQTDAQGRFPLPTLKTNFILVVSNNEGFCLAQNADLVKSPTMVVRPWGRIEGRRLNCGQPVSGQHLICRIAMDFLVSRELRSAHFSVNQKIATDSQGRFAFEFVPPVDISVSGKLQSSFTYLQRVEVAPGKTTTMEIATHGRKVTGRLELAPELVSRIALNSLEFFLSADMDGRNPALSPSIPKEYDTPANRAKWWRDWDRTESGRQRGEMFSRMSHGRVQSDGLWSMDLVQPGKYILSGQFFEKEELAARFRKPLEIPPAAADSANEPFDAGSTVVESALHLRKGDVAPDFAAPTLDAGLLRLSDLRGKYVLLDFWATWCGPCIAEMAHLKAVHDAFGKDARFEMVSLSLDADPERPKEFARSHNTTWPQGFLGDWNHDEVTTNYGVYGIPSIFLIDPDGRILATDLRGSRIKEAVAAALAAHQVMP